MGVALAADYHYLCCGEWFDESVDDYVMQPCPKCGTRTSPAIVEGIPATYREFTPYFDKAIGTQIVSRREEKMLHDEHGVLRLNKQQWQKKVQEPVLHECWKQEHGLPAFEKPMKLPTVDEVKDGLERVRARLANDDSYRKQFDPNHPEFKQPDGGPKG